MFVSQTIGPLFLSEEHHLKDYLAASGWGGNALAAIQREEIRMTGTRVRRMRGLNPAFGGVG